MKKSKFSLAEKKLLHMVIVLVFIQLLIAFAFAYMLINSRQININETHQASINVDNIYYYRIAKENKLLVISDSKYYLFTNRSTLKEHSVHDIYESISLGDQLSLTYYETHSIIWGKCNIVVGAHSETEIYRSLSEYNRGREGLPLFVIILYSIIELIFSGVVFVYIWLNYTTTKGIYVKVRKLLLNQKS